MASVVGLLNRLYTNFYPPSPPKEVSSLRFGILGAARIAPAALIRPAKSHPGVVISAVAARDEAKARKFAKEHAIEKVYFGSNGYQELLDDPSIDAIYNPLPNGLHYEWTMKALRAGKHVLLEKPSANRAAETKAMFDLAREKGLVLLEAFHYRFHPAVQRVKQIVDSGELGAVKSVSASLAVPRATGIVKDDDIRYQFNLGGGALMDMGVYPVSFIRYLLSSEPLSIDSATATPHLDPAVDRALHAVATFPNSITAEFLCDLCLPGWGPFGLIPQVPKASVEVQCEGGSISLFNFPLPHVLHFINVKSKSREIKSRVEKVYAPKDGRRGEEWWTTYRYQLEAFVDKVSGRSPDTWITGEDSVAQMEAIERVYEKAGLPPRPMSALFQK